MKIGIVTIFNVANYGALLQCYSLCKYINNIGYDVILYDIPFEINSDKRIYRVKRSFIPFFKYMFLKRYLPRITKNLHETADLYLVGSDQVWNPDIVGDKIYKFMLDFVPIESRKISYASSFGVERWSHNSLNSNIKSLLSTFDTITVREQSGVSILKDIFNLPSKNVLDPCFLIDDFTNIINSHSKTKYNKNHISIYKLVPEQNWNMKIRNISERLNCKLDILNIQKKIEILNYCGGLNAKYKTVGSWLNSIATATYVITDSFHAMVFSIIFKKQFVVFGGMENRMTRITSLLKQLGLKERVTSSLEESIEILRTPIDYVSVNAKIILLKEDSKKIINEMLNQ